MDDQCILLDVFVLFLVCLGAKDVYVWSLNVEPALCGCCGRSFLGAFTEMSGEEQSVSGMMPSIR
jgi:hypothetical protein